MHFFYLTILLWVLLGSVSVFSYSVHYWLKDDDESALARLVCKPGSLKPPSFRSYVAKGAKLYLRHTVDVVFFCYVCVEGIIKFIWQLDSRPRALSRYCNGLEFLDHDFGDLFRDPPLARAEDFPFLGATKEETARHPVHDEVQSTHNSHKDSFSTSIIHLDISPGAARATSGSDQVGREEKGPDFLRWPNSDKEYQEWKDREDADVPKTGKEIL